MTIPENRYRAGFRIGLVMLMTQGILGLVGLITEGDLYAHYIPFLSLSGFLIAGFCFWKLNRS